MGNELGRPETTQYRMAKPEWMIRASTLAWFFGVVGTGLAIPVILDASWLILLAALIAACVLAAAVTVVFRFIRRAERKSSTHLWITSSLAIFMLLSIALAAPIYFVALSVAMDPPLAPRAVLSNGKKTLIFQGMMHVGTDRFYKQIVFDLERALQDGYVLYYEGIRPNVEADDWFHETISGGSTLRAKFTNLSDNCGLNYQNNFFNLLSIDRELRPDLHVLADVDTLQLKQEYDRLLTVDPAFAAWAERRGTSVSRNRASIDWNDAIEFLRGGNESQRELAGYICRYVLSENSRRRPQPTQRDKLILDFRNRMVVDQIISDNADRIYLTYGSRHLSGIIEELQAVDPTWKVESVSWIRPVERTTHFEADFRDP